MLKGKIFIVMPSVSNSFINKKHIQYYDFIVEELPRFIQMIFPVSTKKKILLLLAYSMGGYGALENRIKRITDLQRLHHFQGLLTLLGD